MKHHGYLQLNVVFFLVFLAGKIQSGHSKDQDFQGRKNLGLHRIQGYSVWMQAGDHHIVGLQVLRFVGWENSPNQNFGNLKLPGDGDDGRFKMTSRKRKRQRKK